MPDRMSLSREAPPVNLFGIGLPEIAVIMVVAFLALGPNRSIDMARTTGRMVRDIRRAINEITSAVNLDDDRPPQPRPPASGSPPPREGPPPQS